MSTNQSSERPEQAGSAAAARDAKPARLSLRIDWSEVLSLRQMGVYYALIVLVDVLALATMHFGHPSYLSATNLTNILYQASLTSIMAVAMTIVLITGNFDLSVASVAALAAALLAGLADSMGFWGAAAVAMAASVGVGLVNGVIVQFLRINAFIVTLATMTAVRGVVLIYTDGHSLAAQSSAVIDAMKAFETGPLDIGRLAGGIGVLLIAGSAIGLVRSRRGGGQATPTQVALLAGGTCLFGLAFAGHGHLLLPKPVVYMAAFAALMWFILQFTVVGRRLYAVGGNPEAARLAGINVVGYRLAAFVLCSASAGFAGILFASRLRSINPAALTGAELTVIASAILGGTSLFGGAGSVVKTVAGALLLYSLTNGFNILNLGANYQGVIAGLVLLAAASIYTVGGERRSSRQQS